MRLGEASGAVLAIPIIESAVRVHNEMATFEEAQVSGRGQTDDTPEPTNS
jgi:nicotinate-nucleotide--dimethylbenzimidazole phosphoribosyltransferase